MQRTSPMIETCAVIVLVRFRVSARHDLFIAHHAFVKRNGTRYLKDAMAFRAPNRTV